MANRRNNNEGTIFRLPSGSLRAQISINGRRLSHTDKTRQEARNWLKKIIGEIDAGLTYSASQTSYEEFLKSWLTNIKSSLRPITWYQYEMTVRKYVVPTLGKVKLIELRPDQIQQLYNDQLKSGMGVRTVEIIHAVIRRSLNHAVKLGILGRNPTMATNPPKYEMPEMKFYDERETGLLLFAARGKRNEALFHLAIVTGLRQSEILGLRWMDLDWQKRSLNVQRQLKRNGKNGDYFTTPKTKSGRRTVLLGCKTIEVLRTHYEQQNVERIVVGDRWQENNLIFPSTIGTPMNQSNLYKNFTDLIEAAGLRKIRFHDLRHTAASLMLNHGIPAIVVSRRLGHSKVSITLDIYGHLMPEMQNEAADLMDELITPVEIKLHTNCTRNDPLPVK